MTSQGTLYLDVSKWVRKAKGNTSAVVRKIVFDLGARVIMRTPVDTGRARANWMFSIGTPDRGTTESLDKLAGTNSRGVGRSVAKANLSEALANYDPFKNPIIYFTNSVPYIGRLEYGSSKQAPQGMIRLTVAEFMGVVMDSVQFIRSGSK